MENAFRSSRLEYRPMEDNDEDKRFFYEDLDYLPECHYLTDNGLFKPKSAKVSGENFKGIIQTSLLSVMICLPGPDNSEKDVDGKHDHKPKKLIPIGFLMLSARGVQTTHHRSSELGIAIANAYQGKGYGPEAIKWALDWAFTHAALHAVRLVVFSFNTRAKAAYERIGFVLDGRKREDMWVNGGWHDVLLYSMLDREWKEIKERSG